MTNEQAKNLRDLLREHYNTRNFPIFIANHGAWDIYANTAGDDAYTAAIPVDPSDGHLPSHFGPIGYARLQIA